VATLREHLTLRRDATDHVDRTGGMATLREHLSLRRDATDHVSTVGIQQRSNWCVNCFLRVGAVGCVIS
jgi:hypothetical protein